MNIGTVRSVKLAEKTIEFTKYECVNCKDTGKVKSRWGPDCSECCHIGDKNRYNPQCQCEICSFNFIRFVYMGKAEV